MKTSTQSLFNVAFFLACLKLPSQTLTCQYNCPQAGQLFSVKTCSPVSGNPGLNQIWNFTQVQGVSVGVSMVSYVTPSTTPSGNLFPQATVAKSGFIQNTYFETDPSGVRLSTASNVTVNAQSLVLPLPFQYGNTHTETITKSYYNGSTKIDVSTTKTLNAVGTGTLILPSGTYNDVLLITGKTVESQTLAGIPAVNNVYNNFSYFYSEKISHHLLYSESKWETGPNPTDYGPYTEFISGLYTDIKNESNEADFGIELAPNPGFDFVQVTFENNENGKILLVNALGKTVQNLHYSGGSVRLDLRELPVGCYTVLVLQRDSVRSKKLMVSR